MKNNIGKTDRIIRIISGITLILLAATGEITGVWSIIALGMASIAILTALVRVCPLYTLLGINSCGVKKVQ